MSYITWQTTAGNLGTVPENDFFTKDLKAVDSGGAPVVYRFLSGELPPGIQVLSEGALQGVPGINNLRESVTNYQYKFVVRASTAGGAIADRTFSITVSAVVIPVLQPESYNLGYIFDGFPYSYQFSALDTSSAVLTFSINSGKVPEGLTLSTDGLLSGLPVPQYVTGEAGLPNYDEQRYDHFVYDYNGKFRSQNYKFTVKVSDGVNFNIKEYSLTVIAKSTFTADESFDTADNGDLNVSYDQHYRPVMITPAGSIGIVREGENFNFQMQAFDAEGTAIGYDLSNVGEEDGFDDATFDTAQFDQGIQQLPNGIAINAESGWISGVVPNITTAYEVFQFQVTPYKLENPSIRGTSVLYTFTVLGTTANSIDWITPQDLGIISEGKRSTLQVEAKSSTGIGLNYSLATGFPQQLPQGLLLTTDGLLIGRPTFRRFSVDGDTTVLSVADSTGVVAGMDVAGPGVGTGAKVIEVVDINSIVVGPAVVAAAGSAITFYNNTKTVVLPLTEPGKTTTITDRVNGVEHTTFDAVREFTVRASTIDNTASSTQTFTVTVSNYNLAPYENLYLKALPKIEQRSYLKTVLSNPSIFPDNLIYRINDPWFGKTKDIRGLILPGVAPSSLSEYIESMIHNHYNKKIRFGVIKTARAVDEFFNTKYEVVYVELIDDKVSQGKSVVKERVDLSGLVSQYFNDDPAYRYLYPNGFKSMRGQVGGTLGFENRGALPDWMTSPQEDGRVIGFVPAAVLAHTVPGGSKIIKYRLETSDVSLNTIDFVADRYQLDNVMSKNFDIGNNRFLASAETTFDSVPRASGIVGAVDFAVQVPFNQINQRSVGYINAHLGGIDGYTNFQSGDTLIFAKQENYPGNTSNNDGWMRYGDSFDSTAGFDNNGIDLYEIIPGYLDVFSGRSEVNQRAGIWKINIDSNDIVTLEFVQEIFPSNRVRIANGYSFSGSILIYDPILKDTESVPSYTSLTRRNNDSVHRTTFDGNGTKFLNYRDIYNEPESGDKYLKFPQIGVFT